MYFLLIYYSTYSSNCKIYLLKIVLNAKLIEDVFLPVLGSEKMIDDIFFNREKITFIDVRSPSEFERGHIPGSYTIPLLSDEVRAIVGTIYVQQGKNRAMHVAMEYVGPRLMELVDQAQAIYQKDKKPLAIYCARGGMRSRSVEWLFKLFQLPVEQVAGGYKAFRNWALQQFCTKQKINILGGKTGSGKTEKLYDLQKKGEQVIDLEALAQHKGSVFGGDKARQATQQQFENDLAAQWSKLDSNKRVWLEDESRKIGSIIIPEALWVQMQESSVYVLETPIEERVKRILKEYGCLDKQFLLKALDEIKDYLGSERYYEVKELGLEGNLEGAIVLLLAYYDKKYEHGLGHKKHVFLFDKMALFR